MIRGLARITDPSRVRALLTVVPQLDSAAILDLVADQGALLEGHFLLQGGAHSRVFFRFARFGQNARAVDQAAAALVQLASFAERPSVVLSPESAGAFLGAAVAKRLRAGLAIAKIDGRRRPTRELRAGEIASGSRVMVINDVATTGRSLEMLIELVRQERAEPVAAAAFASLDPNRLQNTLLLHDVRCVFIASSAWSIFKPGTDDCLGCRDGLELLPASELN